MACADLGAPPADLALQHGVSTVVFFPLKMELLGSNLCSLAFDIKCDIFQTSYLARPGT